MSSYGPHHGSDFSVAGKPLFSKGFGPLAGMGILPGFLILIYQKDAFSFLIHNFGLYLEIGQERFDVFAGSLSWPAMSEQSESNGGGNDDLPQNSLKA